MLGKKDVDVIELESAFEEISFSGHERGNVVLKGADQRGLFRFHDLSSIEAVDSKLMPTQCG